MSIQFVRRVLVPSWILVFGFVVMNAPPLELMATVQLYVTGLLVMPALLLLPSQSCAPSEIPSPERLGQEPLTSSR